LPTTWADCETTRNSERPATNVSPGRMAASSAVREPACTGAISPSAASSASSAQTGACPAAMTATMAADTRSQQTIRRRGGNRSTSELRSVPPSREGTKASVNVRPARKGDPVRWKTSTVSATAATTSPTSDRTYAVKSGPNSATAKASR
jgi:hypothetical protein